MSDNNTKAARHLLSQAAVNGISVVTVSDGALFCLKRHKLLELLETLDAQQSDELIIFVKHGKTVDQIEDN